MTDDKRRFDPPAGPTPEEISARLEALLKRTHELRRAQAAPRPGGQPDDGPTWPPSDRDMATVEVLDGPTARDGVSLSAPAVAESAPVPPTVGRPDWSTLRMRETPPPAPSTKTPVWVWPVIAALILALGLETAYLLWTAPWAVPAVPAAAAAAVSPATPDDSPAETQGPRRFEPSPLPALAPDATPGGAISDTESVPAPSATTGAVRIESDPPGAVVTMEGRERGVTPITIGQLRPGRHDVIVVTPGQGRLDLKVDVSAGQTTRLDASGGPSVRR